MQDRAMFIICFPPTLSGWLVGMMSMWIAYLPIAYLVKWDLFRDYFRFITEVIS